MVVAPDRRKLPDAEPPRLVSNTMSPPSVIGCELVTANVPENTAPSFTATLAPLVEVRLGVVTRPLKVRLPLLLRSENSVPTVTAPPNVKAPPVPPDGIAVLTPPPIVMSASDARSPIALDVLNEPSPTEMRSDWVLLAAPSIGPVTLTVPP